MDETYVRFSYAPAQGHVYALEDSIGKSDLPVTSGQAADQRGFSALCYHSTSDEFNRQVLVGRGDPAWTSMTMFCLPPGEGKNDRKSRKKKMEETIAQLEEKLEDFPGLRPRQYTNRTSGLGRMDKPLFKAEMKELARRMAKYEHDRDFQGMEWLFLVDTF